MKLLIILSLVASLGQAAPSVSADLLHYENDNIGTGSYKFSYAQSNGQKHQQQGELRNEGREGAFVAVKGSYSWVSPDGVEHVVNYIADENGFNQTAQEITQSALANRQISIDILRTLLS